VIKIYLFRFRVALERINYLLLDVKAAHLKKFDINPFYKSYFFKKEYAE
jgi:hypothetical protein